MTLTPDDLPADDSAQQLFCPCTASAFDVVITNTGALAVCQACGQRTPIAAGGAISGYRDTLPHAETIAVQPEAGGPTAYAAWSPEPPATQAETRAGKETGATMSAGGVSVPDDVSSITDGAHPGAGPEPDLNTPAPLPKFSDGVANTYLEGGPYDRQTTWVMEGATDFHVVGYGHYQRTTRTHDGLAVFEHVPPMAV